MPVDTKPLSQEAIQLLLCADVGELKVLDVELLVHRLLHLHARIEFECVVMT